MSTDLNWQELIDRSIGDGPGHRPMAERLTVGRRALRRRQLAVGATTAVIAVVAGGAVWAAAPGETGTGAPAPSNPAVQPDDRTDGQETDGQKTDGQKTDGQVADDAPVHFGEGETLVAADGVTILEQLPHPDLPRNFAGPNDRSAAAWIEADGERTFVLVRETYGEEQVIPWDKGDFDSLEAFLAFAKQRYESGVGLL